MTSLFRRDVLEVTRKEGAKPKDDSITCPAVAFWQRLDKTHRQ